MTSVSVERAGRPRTVEGAFLALLTLVAVDFVVWALDLFLIAPTGMDSMRAAEGEEALLGLVATSAAFSLLLAALGVLLALMLRQGRNWARLLFVAFCALALFMTMVDVGMDGSVALVLERIPVHQLITNAVVYLLGLITLVLLFLPASNAYFSRRKRAS